MHFSRDNNNTQFGTGTWDPTFSFALGRSAGPLELRLSGIARLVLAANAHDYRAGNRYSVLLGALPKLGDVWSADAGLVLAREEPEKWGGRIEEEGNLGRTDLFLSVGGGRAIPPIGALSLNLQLPLMSETTGEQVDIPVIISLTWGR